MQLTAQGLMSVEVSTAELGGCLDRGLNETEVWRAGSAIHSVYG